KLIAHAEDRPAAIARLRRGVAEAEIGGIQTTLPFHWAMLAEPGFLDTSGLATTWVDAHWDGPRARADAVRAAVLAAGLAALADGRGQVGDRAERESGAGASRRDGSARAWRTGGRALAADRWPA
ncbi:MAG TPA: hypothetical protein VLM76_01965, partial [Patescibacteria group bacterium]|nr:hypothetical protein [Patescibacteria group bacterium]